MWHSLLLFMWYRKWWNCYDSGFFKFLTSQIRVPQHTNTCGSLATNRHTGQWGNSEGKSRNSWSSHPQVGSDSWTVLLEIAIIGIVVYYDTPKLPNVAMYFTLYYYLIIVYTQHHEKINTIFTNII